MGLRRFLSNVLHAHEFTTYRIDRVPHYELIRCGLECAGIAGRPLHWLTGYGPLALRYLLAGGVRYW